MKKELGIFILIVVLCAAVTLKNPLFLSGTNLQNMALLVGMYGIFSIGLGLVIITGGIDLSVGSTFALQGVLLAMLLSEKHIPWPLAIALILLLGVGLGALNGILITRVRLQPFVVTLCGLLFYRGLARFIADDQTKGFGQATGFEGVRNFLSGKIGPYAIANGEFDTHIVKGVKVVEPHLNHYFGLFPSDETPGLQSSAGMPIAFLLMLVIAALMAVLLHRTIYGRYLYAVGRNEEAARYSGINTRKVISTAYILSGFLAAISGILIAFYTNSVSPSSHGNFYELYGIAAAVLGGCSLRGGEGSILGILLGTVLLQVLQNLVNLLGIPSSLNFAVMGAVILLGVVADQLLKNRKPKVKALPVEAKPVPA